tara:strand:- start:172 stop:327 length:156 start_codon:yes stop_codon:yes gene_type:complete
VLFLALFAQLPQFPRTLMEFSRKQDKTSQSVSAIVFTRFVPAKIYYYLYES